MDSWTANEECLNILMSMGISKGIAEQALYYTGNNSAEAAASFVFDNPDFEPEPTETVYLPIRNATLPSTLPEKSPKKESNNDDSSEEDEEDVDGFKMVFVTNSSLKMGVGKIASQVAHACLGLYREMIEEEEAVLQLNKWEKEGEKKVILKGDNADHLIELEKKASENKISSYIIRDAGRTQIPSNSVTVLALFGLETAVNALTGKLSLL